MPAKVIFHDTVKKALEKDGWTITDDPDFLRVGRVELFIDLGAEKILAAQKADEKIAVEVKGFINNSAISEFHQALGQFINYRHALFKKEPERRLYLAIPLNIYNTFFKLEFIKSVIDTYQVNLIIYNEDNEEIVEWTK